MQTSPRLSLVHQTRFPAAGDGPHPTVIALHGRGSEETDLLGLAPYLDERLLWISPRAPLNLAPGYEWYRLAGIGAPVEATFAQALKTVARFVDEVLQSYPVDPARLILFGFSQGGMMAYAQALTRPALVQGIICHSSYLPLPSIQAAAAVDEAGLRGLPCLVLHGQHDPLLPVQRGREARDYLRQAGAELTYHEFPIGHTINQQSLAAMTSWLALRLGEKE